MTGPGPIAIVGMACRFAGADSLEAFWAHLEAGVDASRAVPAGRWTIPPEVAFDPQLGKTDRVFSSRGYFLEPFAPDLNGLNLSMESVRDLDTLFHLALDVGNRAFRSAQMERVDRSRIAVILGSIALPTEAISKLATEIIFNGSTDSHPLNREVTGAPARLLADSLNLGGTAYTLDAACASSLYAFKLACEELLSGRADAVLAGGLSRPDCLYTQMGFSQLRAISPSGQCSPLDRRADGLVVGEGAGICVLKRLDDAITHGDTIWGVIRSIGWSNDREGNLLAPASEGQLRAMHQAYSLAGWEPESVQLIECHATGTPLGDRTEVESLQQLWQNSQAQHHCVLGSVKSSVGHLLTGANSASLIKVLLAMWNRTLPPAVNGSESILGSDSRFRLLNRAEPWIVEAGTPRRAAVSGFGFGGINAHLLVEEWLPQSSVVSERLQPVKIAVVSLAMRLGNETTRSASQSLLMDAEIESPRIEQLDFPFERFRIPPQEANETLPQQLLALDLADECHASLSHPLDAVRTGVVLGVSLDPNTTNFHLRWQALNQSTNVDAISPPLTANRTMGALASIAASRVARVFRCGGPSFTVSAGTESGTLALDLAARALERGEIDAAFAGAVDLRHDPRIDSRMPLDSGAILILKRLSDAERDGDTIHAILQRSDQVSTFSTETKFEAGACGQLLASLRSLLAVREQIHPGETPAFWLANEEELPRRLPAFSGWEWCESRHDRREADLTVRAVRLPPERLLCFQADSREGLLQNLDARTGCNSESERERFRVSIWGKEGEQEERINRVRSVIASGSESFSSEGIEFDSTPLQSEGGIAFVYPGSGNHFSGMGREFGVLFPEILRRQQRENRTLRGQYAADHFWDHSQEGDFRDLIFGQVSLGTLMSDLLISLGIQPAAGIGNSLGESASLFGLRFWETRDEMFARMQRSTLFVSDLAPPYDSARRFWQLLPEEQIDWVVGIVSCTPERIRERLDSRQRVYLLIITTPNECVIGGWRADVEAFVDSLRLPFLPIEGVTLAHCEATLPIERDYWDLHHLPVTERGSLHLYSGAWGLSYFPDRDTAADSILAGVQQTIDFPRVIEQAYADGIRQFIEIGPGASCTRMIRAILGDRPHLAEAVCIKDDGYVQFLAALGKLFVAGVNFRDWQKETEVPSRDRGRTVPITVGYRPQRRQSVPLAFPAGLLPKLFESQTTVAAAHEVFLRISSRTQEQIGSVVRFQTALLSGGGGNREPRSAVSTPVSNRRELSAEQCREFAIGSIRKVLGDAFAEIDTFPTRVRLPDGPLLLVDRILQIEGEPLSLGSGRVVTDHHVHEGRWYLDSGRIPTAVAVESGQADLFLSGYLGIDLKTRGLAVYRLLDAVVTFIDSLPKPGEVIVYDIRIDEFFRQGETYLFRFRFAGTVNGKPFLTMRNGCAGFFTEAELASGKGIIHTALDLRPQEGRRPSDWREWVLLREESLDETQVDALREGDLVAAFGEQFKSTHLDSPMRLPGGMLRLVHRVSRILPQGGRFGLGQIRAEYDLRPDDWFLTCHFVDDQVMPGTLMYECCLHTLRIFLMRLGWVGEANEVICEPVREVASRLKCRGQVIASTQRVTYEVTVKELGYQPNAFAIADALMFADGKPIVEIQNMSLQMTGLTREKLERIWGSGQVLFPRERITAFAIGNPSEAFGEPYRVFDTERQIARLPGPPYQFLDRIVSIRAEAWKLQPGGEIIAEYDVPPEEWYFVANRSERMPFSVLLEIALQPCGWLAAYLGSALTTHEDLSFRNLGGKATQFLPVTPNIGVLRTWVKMTKVSTSVGMIIQHFDYEMTSRKGVVYRGDTYFGFFSKPALAQQIGMPKAPWWIPSQSAQLTGSDEKLPSDSPFPDTMMRMIDRINWYLPDGGDAGLGAIEGTIRVDPSMWFFAAHFYQDPVWPGSLGLESFLQLLKLLAFKRWGPPEPGWVWQTVALNKPHEWIYRGQVIPSDTEVTVQAQITRWDDQNRQLWANGFLRVDGRIIYEMKEFSLELVSIVS